MANIPLTIAYEESRQAIVNVVNQALELGVPMFMIETALKDILTEVQAQSKLIYEKDMRDYQAAVAAEQETADENVEEQA